jgi:hypothetical protein
MRDELHPYDFHDPWRNARFKKQDRRRFPAAISQVMGVLAKVASFD